MEFHPTMRWSKSWWRGLEVVQVGFKIHHTYYSLLIVKKFHILCEFSISRFVSEVRVLGWDAVTASPVWGLAVSHSRLCIGVLTDSCFGAENFWNRLHFSCLYLLKHQLDKCVRGISRFHQFNKLFHCGYFLIIFSCNLQNRSYEIAREINNTKFFKLGNDTDLLKLPQFHIL